MYDKNCKWHRDCGYDFCHGEGVCPDFEKKKQKSKKIEAAREKLERENPKTNADRIRSMSDEELAWFINLSPEMEFEVCLYCANGNTVPDDRGICLRPRGVCVANDRRDAFLVWLKQPVKEE